MNTKRGTFIIQKVIQAANIRDALRNEKKAKIVEVVLATEKGKELSSAIGFIYDPQGIDNETINKQ